ncbi:MAG: hypothetical protein HKN87_12175 [Saprospiraceae bacterium]|nr:hypothetical protein [Saprospiraceae bacterium]
MANIIEYIQFNAPGVAQSPNGGISLIGGASLGGGIDSEPLIYIDGGPRLTVDEARGYAAEMFATIEILTPPASNFYRAPAGAVLLTTKSGSNALPNNIDLLGGMVERIKGFSRYRTFYSPKYSSDNIDQEIPDLRYTLYWNPRFIIGGDQSVPTFFSSDLQGRYKIIIQGITTAGEICMGSTEFSVAGE